MDDKEAPMDSLAPSNNIEKLKEDFVAPSYEIEKKTKEYTNTQKVTNILTMISQLESSSPKKIFLEYKIPNNVSLLSVTEVSVTPEIRIPRKKGI